MPTESILLIRKKYDDTHRVFLNQGIVVKSHAGQNYTSDGVSIALFKEICRRAGVPIQFMAGRSDMSGGSTLGHIAVTNVPVNRNCRGERYFVHGQGDGKVFLPVC